MLIIYALLLAAALIEDQTKIAPDNVIDARERFKNEK